MALLRDSTTVARTAERARRGLERFFLSLRGRDGISRLRLRVPMDGSGLSIDRVVFVEARGGLGERQRSAPIEIEWHPEGRTVLPRFEGTLAVSAGRGNCSSIELDGAYTPPFGAAGQVFDAAIGRRIAQATAREFLKDLKAAIEAEP